MTAPTETLHACCVAINGQGVLIEGASGAGKSDLTLRLVDRGAELVSDDYTLLERDGAQLLGRAPVSIAGRIEIRGIGIVNLPYRKEVAVAMLVRIEPLPERLPERPERRRVAGIELPVVALPALEPSAPIKVELALRMLAAAA
ncbi:HPr kinase/phosphorylase [Sphingomonas sp. 3-13AW]|uniref:HPr kinase/phosphorylase n=1 Tax=Sphingomonas sp. 3-13AW TaxID=3050450 RepID=UPI003BB5A3B7